jgi:hypothetical protein
LVIAACIASNRSPAGRYTLPLSSLSHHARLPKGHDRLDAAVSEAVLKVLEPAQMKLAVAALEELQSRDEAILRQWQMRVERSQYEAALAERRYQEADPSNRLVASTLERRWNESLLAFEETQKQYKAFEQKEARAVTAEQKAQILALARDFPRLWHAKSTEAARSQAHAATTDQRHHG